MKFKISSDFNPTGDQPEAITQLTNGILAHEKYQTLLGVTGSGKTFTMEGTESDNSLTIYTIPISGAEAIMRL